MSISDVLPPEGQAFLTSDDAPTLWFIGTNDPNIPNYNDVVANAAALYNVGVFSVPELLQGAGHVPADVTYGPTIYTQSADFLYFALDLAHAAGSPPRERGGNSRDGQAAGTSGSKIRGLGRARSKVDARTPHPRSDSADRSSRALIGRAFGEK